MLLPFDVEIYSQECFRRFHRRYAILSDFFNIMVFIVCYVPTANYRQVFACRDVSYNEISGAFPSWL